MSSIKTVGIIGLGNFGGLLADIIPQDITILGCDEANKSLPARVRRATLEVAVRADVVFLAIPLESYVKVLPHVAKHILPDTLLIDVCSVKVRPQALIEKHLPDHSNMMLTHPLFGPETVQNGLTDLQLIITKRQGQKAQEVVVFCEALGLQLLSMTSNEHDRIMARVHALTYFIARGLSQLGIKEETLLPPSYKSLLNLVNLDKAHSEALFQTMENGNPFAAELRAAFLDKLQNVNQDLERAALTD